MRVVVELIKVYETGHLSAVLNPSVQRVIVYFIYSDLKYNLVKETFEIIVNVTALLETVS